MLSSSPSFSDLFQKQSHSLFLWNLSSQMMADNNSSLPCKPALEMESDTKKNITESETTAVGHLLRAMAKLNTIPAVDTFRDEAKQSIQLIVDENQLSPSDSSSPLRFKDETKVRSF